jgi:hypothetical protein
MAKLVDPAGVSRPPVKPLASRLETLAGARLGLLDNAKPNADAILGAIADRLLAEQGVAEVVRFRKRNPGMGAPAQVLDSLAGCDAVLLGTSD